MKHTGKILILLILIVTLAIIFKLTDFTDVFQPSTRIEIQNTKIDKGRFVGGEKISITDQIRIKQTGQFVKLYPWQAYRNIRKEVKIDFLTESGYFIEDIISSESVDTLRNGEIFGRALIVRMPYPDTLSFQFAGDKTIDKTGITEGWIDGLFDKWLTDKEAIEDFKIFVKGMKQKSYEKFIEEHASPESNLSMAEATMSILGFVNNGYMIGDDVGFSSIRVTYEETQDLGRPTIIVTCQSNGNCKHEILMNNPAILN